MLNRRPGFILYPRGFLGGIPGMAMEKQTKNVSLTSHVRQTTVAKTDPKDSAIRGSDEIERLYGSYIKQAGDVTSVDFRNRVLKTALFAFGTRSFFIWFQEQKMSPAFGDLHRRFLIDTLGFINGGNREMSLHTWNMLVDIEEATAPSIKFQDAVKNFFGCTERESTAPMNDSLVEVIQKWCARPNGIEDLLVTLHILFGNP